MSKNSTNTSLGNMSEVEKVFKKFDTNGDGKISITELRSILTALGSSTSPSELHQMMKEIDTDGDGFIDLHEFTAFHGTGDNKDVRDAFELYDKDKNGVITARELHTVMKGLGEKVSLKECCKMIRSVDVDGDGCINFEEFKKMMKL